MATADLSGFWVAIATAAPVIALAHAVLFERAIRSADVAAGKTWMKIAVPLLLSTGFTLGAIALWDALDALREAPRGSPALNEGFVVAAGFLLVPIGVMLSLLPASKDP